MPLDLFSGTEGPLGGHEPTKQLLVTLRAEFRRYALALQGSDWEELESLSLSLGGLSAQILGALRSNTLAVEFEQAALDTELAVWKEALGSLSTAESAEASAVREGLLQAAVVSRGSEDNAQQQVQRLLGGEAPLTRIRENYAKACRVDQEDVVEQLIAADGLRARAVYLAAFHTARSTEEQEFPVEERDAVRVIAFADEVEAYASGGLAALYGFLVGGADISVLAGKMATVRAGALARLRLCGALQGQVHRVTVPPSLHRVIVPPLVRIAEAAAMLRVVVAVASETIARLASLESEEWLVSQRADASALPLTSAVPHGRERSLAEVGDAAQDSLVELQGIVETLAIEPDPGPKFSTFVTLRALDGERVLRLRAHMFSLQANGLHVGAACKVRGFVRREAPWLEDGETGVDIDRVSLTALRKQSWTDDRIYRMRPFAMVFFDEMNMFYTPGSIVE